MNAVTKWSCLGALGLILGSGVLTAQGVDSETLYTGVFAGDKSTGVASWALNADGTMKGRWTTNRDSLSLDVKGKYQKDGREVIFLVDASVKLAGGETVTLKITGTGELTAQSGHGTYTQFSDDPRIASDTGTWTVVSGYATEGNLTLTKRPPAAARPSPEAIAKKAEVQEIRNAFLPGVSASVLVPFEPGLVYAGGTIHYAFIQGISSSTSSSGFGGYYEWYSEIGYFKELNSSLNGDIFFTYAFGVNLSFEKFLNTYRDVLVPYFGAKVGGISFNKLSGGLYLEPTLGVVLLQTKSFNLNYDAGLFLNTVDLSRFIGVQHSVVLNFNL
jgi:hypothetical protein